MLSKSFAALAISVSGALAATPAGFEPGSETGLLVTFGDVEALNGAVVAKDITQTAPTLATQSKLDGTSFAVLMIDLDIPTDSPPETNTLLHWMQTGLTQGASAETSGSTNAFAFSIPADTAAFAEYLGPAPPAKIPLSHRYTQIIVDTSGASEDAFSTLKTAAATRLGFDALSVLTSADLADKVVAGNFFNVTNQDATAASNGTAGGNGTSPGGSSPSQSPIVGAASSQSASASLLAIVLGGVAFLSL